MRNEAIEGRAAAEAAFRAAVNGRIEEERMTRLLLRCENLSKCSAKPAAHFIRALTDAFLNGKDNLEARMDGLETLYHTGGGRDV